MSLRTCRVCGVFGDAEVFNARERMFGLAGEFSYFQCGACGCLQADHPDIDVSPFYPATYYSFEIPARRSSISNWLLRQRDAAALGEGNAIGRWLQSVRPNPPMESLSRVQLRRDMRIADIGCGGGLLLRQLRTMGFTRLTGIDPNVRADTEVDPHLRILKRHLDQLDDIFDLVMFHHSLEHIPDQQGTMRNAYERLVPGGTCVVRIPLASSAAWQQYRLDWVQLDAPRHLFLHTEKSIVSLAERVGFELVGVAHDSSDFQFWGSETLRQGLPLFDLSTGRPNPRAQQIAEAGRGRWRKAAATLNAQGRGDQAIFLLRRPVIGTCSK
jgi:SAM-dependent methyltransferase